MTPKPLVKRRSAYKKKEKEKFQEFLQIKREVKIPRGKKTLQLQKSFLM
jgi:hypothetical protein